VWRYLSNDPSKNLTGAEASSLHSAGLGVGCVWETTNVRALGGAAAGAADGRTAAAEAPLVGLPHGTPLLANIGDFAATGAQIAAIHAYYYAFRLATRLWQTGAYATRYIIDQLWAAGGRGLFWQNAMDDQGVKGDVVSARAGVYQRIAHTQPLITGCAARDYDENITVNGAAVNWWKPPPPPLPAVITDGVLVSKAMRWTGHRMKSGDGGKTWTPVNP
jgi:hypothetical protein